MRVCIPSYNRLDGVQEKTLKLLKKYNVNDINIFVSTQKDYDEYKKEDIENVVLVPAEFAGIGAVRSFIVNIWANNKDKIVMMDDDLEMVKDLHGKEINVKDFFENFFKKLEEYNLYFGGVPLCSNPFFLKDTWTSTLKYVSGALQFIRVDKSREKIDCRYRHFEDFCYDILYYKRDSGILRYNGASPITKNYNPIGGICDEIGSLEKRLDCEKIADEIIDRFGNKCVSKYFKKKSARGPECWNLRLNWRVSPNDIL